MGDWTCPSCGDRPGTAEALAAHLRSAHGLGPTAKLRRPPEPPDERPVEERVAEGLELFNRPWRGQEPWIFPDRRPGWAHPTVTAQGDTP